MRTILLLTLMGCVDTSTSPVDTVDAGDEGDYNIALPPGALHCLPARPPTHADLDAWLKTLPPIPHHSCATLVFKWPLWETPECQFIAAIIEECRL